MTLTITLQPEIEARFREEASREGLTIEQLTSHRLMEADILWRIRTAVPELETKQFHRLLRKSKNDALTEQERVELQMLLDKREERAAQRMQDLALLSKIRSLSVRQLMQQLHIHPMATP